MTKKLMNSDPMEDTRYHDTWLLLKKYRDVVWSLELSVVQIKTDLRLGYECDIDDLIDSLELAGVDLSGTEIEGHARSIERSNKMLKLVQGALTLLRNRHKYGEAYYWLLYYTYISPQKLKNVEEIIDQLQPHIHDISFRTYYRRRKEAVYALSSVLWGYTTKDSLQILEEFFPSDRGTK